MSIFSPVPWKVAVNARPMNENVNNDHDAKNKPWKRQFHTPCSFKLENIISNLVCIIQFLQTCMFINT